MKKFIAILMVLVLGSICWATDFPPDSNYVWHVAKDGNDDNKGNSFLTAKLTIAAAIAASANGDTLIIWPGTYAENVNMPTAAKSLNFKGVDRDYCIIAPAVGNAVNDYNYCKFENLSLKGAGEPTPAGFTWGLYANNTTGCRVENCYISGGSDGAYISPSNVDFQFRNCYITSPWDALNVGDSDVLVDTCELVSTATYTSNCHGLLYAGGSIEANLPQCSLRVINTLMKSITSSGAPSAVAARVNGDGYAEFKDCTFITSANWGVASAYGLTDKITGPGSAGNAIVQNCTFYTYSLSGTAKDVKTMSTSSKFYLNSSIYNTAKISDCGTTIFQGGAGWSAGIGTEANAALNTYDPPTNAELTTARNIITTAISTSDGNTTTKFATAKTERDANDATTQEAIAALPTAAENRDAIFNKTGITAGGTWTFEKICKVMAAWSVGEWQDKTGEEGVYQMLDAEDQNTPVVEVNISDTSKYREITIP